MLLLKPFERNLRSLFQQGEFSFGIYGNNLKDFEIFDWNQFGKTVGAILTILINHDSVAPNWYFALAMGLNFTAAFLLTIKNWIAQINNRDKLKKVVQSGFKSGSASKLRAKFVDEEDFVLNLLFLIKLKEIIAAQHESIVSSDYLASVPDKDECLKLIRTIETGLMNNSAIQIDPKTKTTIDSIKKVTILSQAITLQSAKMFAIIQGI